MTMTDILLRIKNREYLYESGLDVLCQDAGEEIERLCTEVSAYKPVYEAALEVSRRNSTKKCLGLNKLRDALAEHQEIALTIKGTVSGRQND